MSQAEEELTGHEEEGEEVGGGGGFFGTLRHWVIGDSPWWICSMVLHMMLVLALGLIEVKQPPQIVDEAPSFEEAVANTPPPAEELQRFEIGDAPEEPTELNTDTLTLNEPPEVAEEMSADAVMGDVDIGGGGGGGIQVAAAGPNLGGYTGFDFKAMGPGPIVRGSGGVGVGVGTGNNPGSGGSGVGVGGPGSGFGGRGSGARRAMVSGYGGTKQSERAVAGALNWIARHQMPDGRWSLNHTPACKDGSCTGPGDHNSDTAAAAFGLLPFLAAGQTHRSKGPYQRTINAGLLWLINQQKPDGDLRGAGGNMYSHGLAAITLCEAYGLTGDRAVGYAAQNAINFIQKAQNQTTGGWRYAPGDPGDTSVVGWQLMALKSGMMAGLQVDPACVERVKKFLNSVRVGGSQSGRFGYTTDGGGSNAVTAVGLLCSQYLGTRREDPIMLDGVKHMMAAQPGGAKASSDIYYWYYATQVMHNVTGADWDAWNRKTRRTLIESQTTEASTCANGSWSADKDTWGKRGGRLMQTSLSALTLEVYYRYLPLYKLDKEDEIQMVVKPLEAAPAKEAKKPANKT